jgi:DNA topoisomerase-1
VKASFGHVADLPPKDYGVDLATLEESYVLRGKGAEIVKALRAAVQGGGYDQVLLASDPDREGEAIAWHLARQLKLPARAASRIEFREITAAAVRAAVASPRPVDVRRVDAQRSRRVLDRIVGFDCSKEICWPAGAQSAGRCQTPALHILCEREREILAFAARTYWTLEAAYAEGLTAFVPATRRAGGAGEGRARRARATSRRGASCRSSSRRARRPRRCWRRRARMRTACGRSTRAGPSAGRRRPTRRRRCNRTPAGSCACRPSRRWTPRRRCSRRGSSRITAPTRRASRTTPRRWRAPSWPRTIPRRCPAQAPRARAAKAGAQDAHEAVRPTQLGGEDAPPPPAAKLYAMIRARFLASQAKPAVFDRTTVWIDSGPVAWVAEGAVLREAGFLVFWGPYTQQEDVVLPALAPGQELSPTDLLVHERQTKPPSRYDQGALIKKLETSGIGRPATFAGIIDTLLKRDYVRELAGGKGKQFLQPTEFGMQVDGLMTHTFPSSSPSATRPTWKPSSTRSRAARRRARRGCARGTTRSARRWRARRRSAPSTAPRTGCARAGRGAEPAPRPRRRPSPAIGARRQPTGRSRARAAREASSPAPRAA